MKKSLRWSALGLLTWVAFSACSLNKDDDLPRGKRGESCEARADCEDGLVCVGGVCGVGDFHLTPTGKECALVQCSAPEDCCPVPPADLCTSLKSQCDAGSTSSCEEHRRLCVCDGSPYFCEQGKCGLSCTEETASTVCLAPARACAGGRCVQCDDDVDCPSSTLCVNNACQAKCARDNDCTGSFQKCQDSVCVTVGCTSDGQCIADRKNRLAVCKNAKCSVPCASDLECPLVTSTAPGASSTLIQACVGGECVDVGCDSDDQCRILLPPTRGTTQESVCRPKTTP